MNVGELLRERDRLLGVIEEAKIARSRIRQLNVLIAMYGDDEKVAVINQRPAKTELCLVPECGNTQYIRGLCGVHYTKWQKKTDGWKVIDKFVLPSRTGGRRPKALRKVS